MQSKKQLSVRSGEDPQKWYRNERLFQSLGRWYFRTREGVEVGPYPCRFDAELECESLINLLRDVAPDRAAQVVDNHVLAACSGERALTGTRFTSYLVAEGGVELLRDG